MPGPLHQLGHRGFNVAGSVLAYLGVVANDLFKGCFSTGKKIVWQTEQTAKLRVLRYQYQIAIEHTQTAGQILQHIGHELVAFADGLVQFAPVCYILKCTDQHHWLPVFKLHLTHSPHPNSAALGRHHGQFEIPALAGLDTLLYGGRDNRLRFGRIEMNRLL